jgi:hypothetical protein
MTTWQQLAGFSAKGANRLEDLDCSALEFQTIGQRKKFLERECCGDTKLRAEVEEMLVRQPIVEEFFRDIDLAGLLAKAFSNESTAIKPHG